MTSITLSDKLPGDKDSIQNWLVDNLARSLGVSSDQVDTRVSLERYGLDSARAIEITGDLSNWLGIGVNPELFYDYPTIEKATNHLVEELQN
jgi:acyl carrier protein